jgi:hypothetical protein
MDWFESLTGFREGAYEETRARLSVRDGCLWSSVNGRSYGVGQLELVSLTELRQRTPTTSRTERASVQVIEGDVRLMHRDAENRGALFQVASQFNLLEMVNFDVSPEDGVTCYARDPTQGPACAIAAGAATIYRNYFAPVRDQIGQTTARQLDGLADLGAELANAIGTSIADLWEMRNGYALCHRKGLLAIGDHLADRSESEIDALRGRLRIGVHRSVEVTEGKLDPPNIVSQAFCSALPVAYGGAIPRSFWAPLAQLVLDAAYEATLLAAVENRSHGGSPRVFLTRLGGGAFGNDDLWIDAAMLRAIEIVRDRPLDIRLVSYGKPSASLIRIAVAFA